MTTTRKLQAGNQISSLSVACGTHMAEDLTKFFIVTLKLVGKFPPSLRGMTIKQLSRLD